MPSVSVVIPARNDAANLKDAIASVSAQRNVEIDEIVVAVGPSSDGTEVEANRLAMLHDVVRVVQNPAGFTPSALNLAIADTTGEVVVRVDARSVLPVDYVASALETMHVTGASNVGAIQMPKGTTSTERAVAAAMQSRLGSGGANYRHATETIKVGTAYLGVFRRSALDDVGGFDETFIRNQDSELNIRLRAAGHEIWLDPRMVVEYRPRGSLVMLASQYYQYGWWRARTVRKHPGSLRLRQVAAPAVVVAIACAIVLGSTVSAAFLVLPAAYCLVLVASAASAQRGLSPVERAKYCLALATIHFSWGAGMIASMVTAPVRSRRRAA